MKTTLNIVQITLIDHTPRSLKGCDLPHTFILQTISTALSMRGFRRGRGGGLRTPRPYSAPKGLAE